MGPVKINKFVSQKDMDVCNCSAHRTSKLTQFLLNDNHCHVKDEGTFSAFDDALVFDFCDALNENDEATSYYIGEPHTSLPKYLEAFAPNNDAVCEVVTGASFET
jgi:hypothetical protein